LSTKSHYIATIRREAVVLPDPTAPAAISRDPNDDYLIALAQAAGAHYLVSGDRDLTELTDPPTPIARPREFLLLLQTAGE
jgi:predicted nucleic acid-binding protein